MPRPSLAAAATALAALSAPAAAAVYDSSAFYVFGDSLSDTGAIWRATDRRFPPPPYYEGRFSGGPVWADIAADRFEEAGADVENYAVGGATARGSGPDDLEAQVARFAADRLLDRVDPGPDPLAAIWIGGNDLLRAAGDGAPERTGTRTAGAVEDAARDLSDLGVDDFLLFTLPDLAAVPTVAGSADAAEAGASSVAFNDALAASADALRADGLGVTVVDVAGLFDDARADPAAFGLTNIVDPCVVRDGLSIESNCADEPGVDPDGYLFFDQVHPGARAHAAIADALEDDAQVVTTPLPPAGFLLLGGLAAVAVARRARA